MFEASSLKKLLRDVHVDCAFDFFSFKFWEVVFYVGIMRLVRIGPARLSACEKNSDLLSLSLFVVIVVVVNRPN